MCDIAPICGRNVCFCTFVYFLRFVFCFHESVLYLWDLVFYLRDSFYICVIRFVFVRFVLYLCVAVVGHRRERLQFLRPVMQPGKSRDSMQSSSENSPESSLEITVDLEESSSTSTPSSQKSSKSSVEAKKHELLATCINVLKEPVSKPKGKEDHFALYVAQKLDGFDSRKRAVAEKRITDIIFDLEINGLSQYAQMPYVNQENFNHGAYSNAMGLQNNGGEYLSMLQ